MSSWIEGSQETVADVKIVLRGGLSENHKAVLFFALKLVCNGLGDASWVSGKTKYLPDLPCKLSGQKHPRWTIAGQQEPRGAELITAEFC